MALSPQPKHPHEAPTGYFLVGVNWDHTTHFEYNEIRRTPARLLTDRDTWALEQGLLHRIFTIDGHRYGLVTRSRAYVAKDEGKVDRWVIRKHTRYVDPAGEFAKLPRVRCSYQGKINGESAWVAVAENCDGSELARALHSTRTGAIQLLTADQRISAFRAHLKVNP